MDIRRRDPRPDRGSECLDALVTCGDAREHGVWVGQRLEREDPRAWIEAGRKHRELAAIGADVDHAREVAPRERAGMLDGRGDAVAQARTKPAIGDQMQQLPRAPHQICDGARIRPHLSWWLKSQRRRGHAR